MTRTEQIIELELLLQQLRGERQIDEWLARNEGAAVVVTRIAGRFSCRVICGGRLVATGDGATEADARAQAFSKIFLGECDAA